MRRRHRKPHRIRRKKSIFKKKAFWGLVFSLLLFGTGFYFFVFSDVFQIQAIIITGEQRVAKESLESIIKAEARNIIFVDSGKIRELVLQKFPQIAELEIKRDFPNILNLALAERKEVGVFCQDTRCFLLDGQGVIFEEFTGETSLPKFQNQTINEELVPGEKVFEKETLDIILEIEARLKEGVGVFSEEISLVSSERLNTKTSEGWQIYFNIKNDLNWQIVSLATILEKRLPPEKRKSLEYIDLRFDKIFVYPQLD